MDKIIDLHDKKKTFLEGEGLIILILLLLVIFLYLKFKKDLQAEKTAGALTVQNLRDNINTLEQQMAEVKSENDSITATLTDQQKANLELEREKNQQDRKIDNLTRLTTIDPEILKKYSKVFFLSENYVPKELVSIEAHYLASPTKTIQISRDVLLYLQDLLDDANRDHVTILVASGYRSFNEQKNLKDAYTVEYGAGTANSFSAEQGYSEHQLGTTLDFTTPALQGVVPAFDSTSAYKWLNENAYKYGFILSYPKGNAYYKYEPWHWRFVGKDLAGDLHDDGKYFYELDQRDIDKYLIKIFD